jgi:hypothetical protein
VGLAISMLLRLILGCAIAMTGLGSASARALTKYQQLALDIFKELVEINTVTATGDTARAAEAMSTRLRAAGFDGSDVQVFPPAAVPTAPICATQEFPPTVNRGSRMRWTIFAPMEETSACP